MQLVILIISQSIQIVPTTFLLDNIKQRLRAEPPPSRRTHGLVRERSVVIIDLHRLTTATARSGVSEELGVTAFLKTSVVLLAGGPLSGWKDLQEPEDSSFDCFAYSQKAVVLKQSGFRGAECFSYFFPLYVGEDDAIEGGVA